MRFQISRVACALLLLTLGGALSIREAQGDEPAPSRALTFTIAAAANSRYGTYAMGNVEPLENNEQRRILEQYAREKDTAGAFLGFDEKTRLSGNWLALRCDSNAPTARASALLNHARDMGLHRFALALTQDFPESDFQATRENAAAPWRRPVHTGISERYRLAALYPPVRGNIEGVTLLLAWKPRDAEASFCAVNDNGGNRIAESVNCLLSAVTIDHKAPIATREASIKRRRELVGKIASTLETECAPIAADKPRLTIAPEALKFLERTMETPPWLFALLALDGAIEFNARRAKAGKPKFLIDFLPATLPKPQVVVDPAKPPSKAFAMRRDKTPRDNGPRILAALQWLADHQSADGSWSAAGFAENSARTEATRTANLEFVAARDVQGDKGWEASADIGVTGLALLAFAGWGCDLAAGDFHEACSRGVRFLLKNQSNDGCFGPKESDHFTYSHAMATAALAEFYGLTADALLKSPIEHAVKFILEAQNPGMGWRYGVRYGESDTSVTGWMISAIHAAKLAGIEIDAAKAFGGAAQWLDAVTVDLNKTPKTGYNMPGSDNARPRAATDYSTNGSMDAVNIYCRLAMGAEGWDTTNTTLRAQAKSIGAVPPKWEHHSIDYYYWYWASNAMFQLGGESWTHWQKELNQTLIANQRGWRTEDSTTSAQTLDEHGSWDAVDAWSSAGGRVYATAMCCLMLETPFRYARFSEK